MYSVGIKGNFLIKLPNKFQLSPSLDVGFFWLSDKISTNNPFNIYFSPALELRKDLGKLAVFAGVEGDFLNFDNPDLITKFSTEKTSETLSSISIKAGLIFKFL
jgi:hypothetical protein